MAYERYRGAKADRSEAKANGRETSKEPQNVVEAIDELLFEAKKVKENDTWGSPSQTQSLRDKIRMSKFFGSKGDRILLELITNHNPTTTNEDKKKSVWADELETSANPDSRDFSGIGKPLLCWMLRDRVLFQYFIREPSGDSKREKRKPIHWAIEKDNLCFLACFFGICHDPGQRDLRWKIHEVLEQYDRNVAAGNCLHYAIEWRIPFVPFLAAVCSTDALKKKDEDASTPLHIAMGMKAYGKQSVPDKPVSAQEADTAAPGWDNAFNPKRVLQEILGRDDAKDIMATILTTINKTGDSLFQKIQKHPDRYDVDYQRYFKGLIFEYVEKISDISKALYGTKGDVKELCLDMSDFNQSSHNFETFVDKLTQLDVGVSNNESVLQFEDTLFFVHLPDLNYVKQPCPHNTIYRLFHWLDDSKNVRTIKKLSIPDNTTNPLADAFVQQHIIDIFNIEELDWRKLDVNLDIITRTAVGRQLHTKDNKPVADTRRRLAKLTLYSSGNWSALYHWISEDGLAKLPQLREVRINIVHLNPAEGHHDETTHDRHKKLANQYKGLLESKHKENQKRNNGSDKVNFNYQLEVKVNAKWDYPPPPHELEEPTTQILKHQFTGQLLSSLNALQDLKTAEVNESSEENSKENDNDKRRRMQILQFQKFALKPPGTEDVDRRIKVAIIDNGADRIRSKFRHMIAKGQSYVKADQLVNTDQLGSDRSLPWWMVSDPHGTQMASLIGQTNDYCRLYIARVGKGRNDIQPGDAAKAIDWAVEQKVDIISISWTLKKKDEGLKKAIERAAKVPTLIFCSTPDQGVYSEAWPVGYREHVLSVSATNHWGHLTDQTAGADPVDIMIPGENIQAAGPSYIGNVMPTVSGSSVATALAAGIASLALLMLRTFNEKLAEVGSDEGDREAIREFYTRKGMKCVFGRMGAPKTAIQLSKLFPYDLKDEEKTLEILAEEWNLDKFPTSEDLSTGYN